MKLVIDADRPLSKDELAAYRALHQRRRAGEPVAYLLGVREFYGRPFRVDARVLVPRPDTEILVETALLRTHARSLSMRVLDLCTGSGCVAITIARERPTATVIASDISPGALDVARENAVRLGAFNVAFFEADLLALPEHRGPARFDLITANPPYIADDEAPELPVDVRNFEPHGALFAGADGLDLVRRIVDGGPSAPRRGRRARAGGRRGAGAGREAAPHGAGVCGGRDEPRLRRARAGGVRRVARRAVEGRGEGRARAVRTGGSRGAGRHRSRRRSPSGRFAISSWRRKRRPSGERRPPGRSSRDRCLPAPLTYSW